MYQSAEKSLVELRSIKQHYVSFLHAQSIVVRTGVIVDAEDALTWALDEIAQLRSELADSESENAALNDELSTYLGDELIADQRLDYYRAV